jgi:OTU domain-containing protein 6
MGAKKQRVKAAIQTYSNSEPEPVQDNTLLDDLLAQLDSNNPTVQKESSVVLQEMQQEQEEQSTRKSSKARFKEREVIYNLQ